MKQSRKVYSHNYYMKNKDRIAKTRLLYERRRPEVKRRSRLKYLYKKTPEEVERLIQDQGGVCPCCGVAGPSHIDHDHACCPGPKSCGKCVRGVLCLPCNTFFGRIRDNHEVLEAMAAYLIRGKRQITEIGG